jgi:hypothetical protein
LPASECVSSGASAVGTDLLERDESSFEPLDALPNGLEALPGLCGLLAEYIGVTAEHGALKLKLRLSRTARAVQDRHRAYLLP